MKEKTTIIKKWRFPQIHSRLWLLTLFTFLTSMSGWAWDIDYSPNERNASNGMIHLCINGDEDDWPDCESDFLNNQFYTISFFDNASGRWCYEFYIRQYEPNAHDSEGKYNSIDTDIQVWVMTKDSKTHTLGTIENNSAGNIKDAQTNYGTLKKKDGATGVYQYYPTTEVLLSPTKGFNGLKFSFMYNHNRNNKKDKEFYITMYKGIKEGMHFDYTPVPEATLEPTTDSYIQFNAHNVPGGAEKCYYNWQVLSSDASNYSSFYNTDLTAAGTGWNKDTKNNKDVTVVDNTVRLSPKNGYSVCYTGVLQGNGRSDLYENPYNEPNPTAWNHFSKTFPAYIYAQNLQATEFDQWKKQVTISWTAVRGKCSNDRFDFGDRSDDGEWHLFREYKDGNNIVSEDIAQLKGTKTDSELRCTDTPPEYDRTYTYRVIFVPTYMNKSSDFSWFESALQPTVDVSTNRQVNIQVNQVNDESISGIKLEWTYNIQQSGSTFRVERRSEDTDAWSILDDSQQSVVTSQTKASYIDHSPASSCEFYDYRVVATTMGTEFMSNELTNCHLPAGTKITGITATKGTEEKVVIISWTVDQKGTTDTYFNIERRTINNDKVNDWTKVGETHGVASEYTFTDERVQAGCYYEYRVIAHGAQCDEQVVQSDEMTTVGFSQSSGTITGNISFGTGNSVKGVHISLIKSGTDSNIQQFYTNYVNGAGSALTWTPDASRYGNMLTSSKPMAVQLWAAPVSGLEYMPVFSIDNVMEVGVAKKGDQYELCYVEDADTTRLNVNVTADRFSHITASYGGDKWTFYLHNGDSVQSATATPHHTWTMANDANRFYAGASGSGHSFTGLIDEVRVWNKELDTDEINTNYDRLLGGTESGLILYWPLDENINGYAFDISKQGGVNNENHATVDSNVRPSSIIPAKLSLYGLTDSDGNYIIKGVPFDAGGTNYKIVPEYGVHNFSPTSRNLYISPSSLTANNVDFTDKSSFPMSGYIYYCNTNIPAKGIYLYIDGDLVTANGQVAQTDENGFYNISVPIGEHYVEAKQSGHVMVNDGRWPTKGTFDFQAPVQQNFSDSTLMNFCGRVAGGEIQDGLPVGFGKASGSKNNIGVATITLGLNNPNLSFNCEEGTTNDRDTTRPFYAQNPDTIKSTTWAGEGTSSRYIYIKTDPETGEFSAMLPPLKYNVTDIKVATNDEISFSSLPEIDLTNCIAFKVDTLMNLEARNEGSDDAVVINSYKYSQKMVQTWYATPTLEITDGNDDLNIGAFGLREYYGYEDEYGVVDSIEVYKANADNTPLYLYDYPIYKMLDIYTYNIKGYEKYTNYDDAEPVDDIIPMKDQVLTVENEMSSDQRIMVKDSLELDMKQGSVYNLQANQLVLDSIGQFRYQWTAGLPNTVSPYTRHIGITYKRNDRTYSWDGIDAMVFGSLPLGNNFVTKGPDNVLMVLRDPPGSNSSTSWVSGKTKTKTTKKVNSGVGNFGVLAEILTGAGLTSASGVGFAIISQQKAATVSHLGLDLSITGTDNESTVYTMTNSRTISTSNNKEYVGANGDVYIGVSTNLLLGDCKKVGFFRDGPADDTFAVKDSMAVSVSDSVSTTFMYSQREIETKQIPEWEAMRAQLLIPVASKAEAESYPNPTNESLYVTWQDINSDEWIADENYMQIPPKDNHFEEDMVNYYTQQVKAWKKVMENNEADKVRSMSSSSKLYSDKKNFSFDTGASYNYTERNDTTETDLTQFDYSVMGKGDIKLGTYLSAGATFGINLSINAAVGYKGSYTTGDYDDNYTDYAQFTYNFSDSNIGADYTIDSYKSLAGWTDVFSVLGGQTYCPYEGEVKTKYFEPGKHTLSNATAKMQNPQIRISNGKQEPSSHAEMLDVPTGQPAYFTLTLANDAETDMGMTFVLGEKDGTNPNGLQFTIDGVHFNSGRSLYIPANSTVVKTLEVRQSDTSILDYEDVMLTFASSCQNDLTSVNGVIMDKCTLNVHFKPSSSPVTLDADAFVVNTVTAGELKLTLTDFDRNFQGIDRMGVEYKADGGSSWTEVQAYVFKEEDVKNEEIVVPEKGDVTLKIDMSDNNSYPDGTYIFRAYTETLYGTEHVRVYSEEVQVVRDMIRPTALGTPHPTDGILHHGDDLMVEFNEDIVPGYVNASNVQVTAKVNTQPTTHEVSLHLSGEEPTAHTETDLYMRGNSTVGMWLKYTKGGTIFRHCAGSNALIIGIDEEGHIKLSRSSDTPVISEAVVPMDKWVYFAYSYNEETTAVDMLMQYDTETKTYHAVLGEGRSLEQVVYADDKRLFLGGDGMEGDIHDLCIYSITRDVNEMASEKYVDKDVYRAGLMAHWPMDEGQGTTARDLRNNAHPMMLSAPNWRIDNVNYAATVDATKQQHLDLDISRATTDDNGSYVLEFWFNAYEDLKDKTIFQLGTDEDNIIRLFGKETGELTLQYGAYLTPVTTTDFDATTGWHHFALNVMRGSTASVMIDGKRTAVFSEDDVPPVEGAKLVLGAGFTVPDANTTEYTGYMSGAFDEVRLWHGLMNPEIILSNMYHTLDTLTAGPQGLTVYYPMEANTTVSGVETKAPSDKDLAPNQTQDGQMSGVYDLAAFTQNSAPLKNTPEMQTVNNTATVSDRKIVITLQPNSLSEIEGTTLDVSVTKIFDKNGNTSQPVTWQVYVHQNTLNWEKDSVNIVKPYGEEATFDVVIKNTGNSTEMYRVKNLPTWLTVESSEGSLAPEAEQIIRFQVDKKAAIGHYDVSLSLIGNSGISEPLRVVMFVKGEAPDWTVDTNKYEDHMSMVAQVLINGVVSENSDSRLAAFIGNECVGVATPEKARGSFFIPMTIYGSTKEHSYKTVQFKYWDGATGITYTGMEADPKILFMKDSMKGSYNYPVLIKNTDEISQALSLPSGWNWISFYVNPANGVDGIINISGLTEGDVIKDRTHVSYYDGSAWSFGSLSDIQVGNMYKMNVQQPVNIELQGSYCKPSETPVTLENGWNWIGYTPTSALDINEALSGTGAVEGDYIKSKTAFAIYGPYGWEGNLKTLEPGKGYMMYTQVLGTHTFTYPDVSNNSNSREARVMSNEDYVFHPANSNQYPDNMSMVIKLVYDAQAVDTAEVAAFINEECRATTKATNGLYYLMIPGEGYGDNIELRTVFKDKVITIDKSQVFESDGNIGLPWNPYVIDLGNALGIWSVNSDGIDDPDARFFLPNGIEVDKSMLHKGQVYIVKYGNGKTVKYRK